MKQYFARNIVNPRLLAIFLILLLVLVAYSLRVNPTERVILALMQNSLVAEQSTPKLDQVLTLLLQNSQYENRWQINKHLRSNYINLFVFDSRNATPESLSKPEIQHLVKNCSFIGDPGVIVCDQAMLDTFLSQREVVDWYGDSINSKELLEKNQSAFLHWIIGHELGHIVKGHKPTHFAESQFKAMVESSSLSHKQEYEADEFLVDIIRNNERLRLDIEVMLIDVTNADIRKKVGRDLPSGVGIIYDYNNRKVVEYLRRGTHPEYLIRAVRMIKRLATFSGDKGLLNLIDGLIDHIQEKPVEGNFSQ